MSFGRIKKRPMPKSKQDLINKIVKDLRDLFGDGEDDSEEILRWVLEQFTGWDLEDLNGKLAARRKAEKRADAREG